MPDYFEIDFLDVESPKSGDAITLRYQVDGLEYVHIVDAGFQALGNSVAQHVREYYGNPAFIDHVVATHPDGDHAGGLRTVLEEFDVGRLWMLRPWLYADEIIHRFAKFTSVDNLRARLKQIYPNLAALEEIATKKGIQILDPFQGEMIGAFRVLAPSRARYLDLIVESERTPESVEESEEPLTSLLGKLFEKAAAKAVAFAKAAWGIEVFSTDDTSAENEMSVVQYATIAGKRILLTADTGRAGLAEAADFAPLVGIALPGIDRIQVPHHGSRRNVSTETLDRWLGERLPNKPAQGEEIFTAIVSSAKEDEAHPRNSVVRAFMHRGGKVVATEGTSIRTQHNAPPRNGWGPVTALGYPEDQEED